jgi:hypothetical protein
MYRSRQAPSALEFQLENVEWQAAAHGLFGQLIRLSPISVPVKLYFVQAVGSDRSKGRL